MILKQLNIEFLKDQPFLNNINLNVTENSSSESLHSFISFNTGLLLNALNHQNNNRLIICVPASLKLSQWLAFLISIANYKKDYIQNTTKSSSFKPGQKLFVNGAIVEYVGEEWDEKWGLMISIKCRVGNKDFVTISQPGLEYKFFQVTDSSKRLSSNIEFSTAMKSVQQGKYPIDQVLDITSYGNRGHIQNSTVLISRIGQTETFINQQHVNGIQISDLLGWAKIDDYGNLISLDRNKVTSQPSSIVASNLYSLSEYVGEFNLKKTIIIDGTAKCLMELPQLDTILEEKPNVIVISDLTDLKGVSELIKRDFKVWQWNKEMIEDLCSDVLSQQTITFSDLNYKLNRFCHETISLEKVSDGQIEQIADKTFEFVKLLPEDQQDLIHVKYEIVGLVNNILRMTRSYNQDEKEEKLNILQNMKRKFDIHDQWLNTDFKNRARELFELLVNFFSGSDKSSDEKNIKLAQLIKSHVQNTSDKNLLILCSNSDEAEKSSSYWVNKLGTSVNTGVQFISLDSLDEKLKIDNEMIITGWLGLDKMNKILNGLNSDKITLLCYGKEANWFESATSFWDRANNFNIDYDYFAGILKISKEELEQAIKPTVITEPSPQTDIEEVIKIEYKLKKHQLSKFLVAGLIGEESVLAKPIGLSSSKIAFFTDTHKIYLLNDILEGNSERSDIPHIFANELKEGDKILFRDSSRDIIRDIAEKMLTNAGKGNLSITARIWKQCLREEFNRQARNFLRLSKLLQYAGCNRHPTTIKQWVLDDDQIGPRDVNDMMIIAKVTDSQDLKDKMEEVKSAIIEVRSAHQQASAFIVRSLKEAIIKKIEDENSEALIEDSLSIDLGQYGLISVLTANEVDNEWVNIDRSKVNKPLRRDD